MKSKTIEMYKIPSANCKITSVSFAIITKFIIILTQNLTLAIIFLDDFQLLSFGIFPLGAKSTMTAAVTFTTAPGGEPKDFSSVKLF